MAGAEKAVQDLRFFLFSCSLYHLKSDYVFPGILSLPTSPPKGSVAAILPR